MNTTNAVTLYNNFRNGTPMPLMAIVGATAGNRFLITVPNARAVGFKPGNRDGLGQNAIDFQCDGAVSDAFTDDRGDVSAVGGADGEGV